MMRFLLLFFLFGLASFSWLVSQQQPNLPSVEYGGINSSDTPVRLFERADSHSRVSAELKPGDFAAYLFSGETGKWHYISYDERELAVYGQRVSLNYVRVAGRWVFSTHQIQVFAIICSLLGVVLLFVNRPSRREVPVQPSDLKSAPALYEQEIDAALNRQKRQLQAEHQQELSKQHQINEHLKERNQQLMHRNNQLEQKLEDDLESLKKDIEAEARKQYQPTLEGMQQSYRALEKMHDRLKAVSANDLENARVFDVDLRHVNLESILKGRRFEQCIAKCMQDKLGFTIESWTPDKGFLSGIYVQANKDPDLLLCSPSGQRVAIECKYRSKFFKDSNGVSLSWSQIQRADEYKRYGEKSGMRVFIALGVGGDAASPDQVFLVPVATLMSSQYSSVKKIKDNKYFSTPKSTLERWQVDVETGMAINERLLS